MSNRAFTTSDPWTYKTSWTLKRRGEHLNGSMCREGQAPETDSFPPSPFTTLLYTDWLWCSQVVAVRLLPWSRKEMARQLSPRYTDEGSRIGSQLELDYANSRSIHDPLPLYIVLWIQNLFSFLLSKKELADTRNTQWSTRAKWLKWTV